MARHPVWNRCSAASSTRSGIARATATWPPAGPIRCGISWTSASRAARSEPLVRWRVVLRQNPDAAASGTHPLVHYLTEGAARGRDPHPRFDAHWYATEHPEAAGNPMLFHIRTGHASGFLTERPVTIADYLPAAGSSSWPPDASPATRRKLLPGRGRPWPRLPRYRRAFPPCHRVTRHRPTLRHGRLVPAIGRGTPGARPARRGQPTCGDRWPGRARP